MQFNFLASSLVALAVTSVCATAAPTKGMPFSIHDQQTDK